MAETEQRRTMTLKSQTHPLPKMPGSKRRWALRWFTGYWLLLITLTHWPNPWPHTHEPKHFDKLVHFSLYAMLATLALHALTVRSAENVLLGAPRNTAKRVANRKGLTAAVSSSLRGHSLAVLLSATAFALLDEATQPLTGRDFDWWDWLADGLGAWSGVIAYNAWRLRGAFTSRGESTMTTYKQLTDFLVSLGTDKVPHTNEVFLAHLIGVYRDLESWGCDDDLCRAGMFHSIYGTERFQRFSLPIDRRGEVRDLIGWRAEWLAYLNCFMDRASFDRA
ncbi:MAG TPA: VanZ family protein, partial [Pirellulales bacterium]|nr:VanZ family protein [Pirellulales bacterium]